MLHALSPAWERLAVEHALLYGTTSAQMNNNLPQSICIVELFSSSAKSSREVSVSSKKVFGWRISHVQRAGCGRSWKRLHTQKRPLSAVIAR